MLAVDIMMDTSYAKAAMKILSPTPDNFRIYCAEWIGNTPADFKVMKVTGAEFAVAKRGPNAGKLSVLVKGTKRTAFVTREEMVACDVPVKTGGV